MCIVLNSMSNSWQPENINMTGKVSSQQMSFASQSNQTSGLLGKDGRFLLICFHCWQFERKGDTNTCQRSTWHPGLFWIPVKAVMGSEQNGALSLSEAVSALITESSSAVLACWQECRYFLCVFCVPLSFYCHSLSSNATIHTTSSSFYLYCPLNLRALWD